MQPDDDGMRARVFRIKTKRKCQEEQVEIAGTYLLHIETFAGEISEFVVADTARLLEWYRDLDPPEVKLLIGRDEDTCLPELFAEDVVALH